MKAAPRCAVRAMERGSRRCVRPVVLGAVYVLILHGVAEAYIGPGAGFAAIGSFFVMFAAMLSAVVTLFTWPVRYVFRAIRGWRAHARSRVRRFVVLGLDGMEPTLAERFMAEGKMPHLARLRETGCYRKLGTTTPPLSPVAWSSFLTGSNPGKHNVYDFLTRDRRTYLPQLSSVSIRGTQRRLKLGPLSLPLGKPDIRLLRKGKPFWNVLGEHGIFSSVIRVPITFPPERFRGVLLSAMCVPDLRGSQGTFSFYTTRNLEDVEHVGGEQFQVARSGNRIEARLVGPDDPLGREKKPLTCPFTVVTTDAANGQAELRVDGEKHRLVRGQYTDWVRVTFRAGPGVKIRGICQFLLLSTAPDFELYVTPVNIDPDAPAMPISYPAVYATYLSKSQGPYATLGLAEDTWGLNARILDDDGFLHQCIQADEEREAMFLDALDKVKRGLCVCVFDGTDRIQHMFWRYIDPEHPAHGGQGRNAPGSPQRSTPPRTADAGHDERNTASSSGTQAGSAHRNAIEELYVRMDELVGRTMARCQDEDTVLMVISDHGFKSFRYGIDLNRWLEEEGYLHRLPDGQGRNRYLGQVDWSRTRAYALGLAGIYLNIRGREAQGIVSPGEEADALREELRARLAGLVDARHGAVAIRRVFNSREVYKGPYKGDAPDLIIGYNEGYRVSWEAAVGELTDRVFHDNTKAWSGDHCIDPEIVPGVLFCNRPVATEHPRLLDIGPTVLREFGVDVPRHMDGRPLDLGPAGGPTADTRGVAA